MLLGNKAVSLLMVGVTQIVGEFEADDIIRIMDEQGNQIEWGNRLTEVRKPFLIGKSGSKPIIHYDYLYIEK